MRILLLTQWFDPEPTFKGLLFARELRQRGHQVEVITGFPNYPGGKVYEGYRQKLLYRESIDGISIARVPLYPSHDGSAIKRVLNYASFAFTASLYGIFKAKKADVIYVYHPPMTVGLAGAVIGLFRRTPFVYDVQDLWPDTLRATGMISSSRVLRLVGSVCKWIYKRADHVVVLSPGFRDLLVKRGVQDSKLTVIYNWCDETALRGRLEETADLSVMDCRFNVVFAGTMGRAQALDAVIDAAGLVASRNENVQFVFVGGGIEVESLKQKSALLNLKNVKFLPRMPMSEVGSVLARADALLVHLKDDPLFEITIPSKTQAYLAAGKPVLMAVRGDAAKIIQDADAGLVIEPENSVSIAEGVLRIAAQLIPERELIGRNAATFYKEKMSLESGVENFIEVFKKVIEKRN